MPRAFQKVLLKWKLGWTFIFTLLYSVSKGFMKAFKAFIKPFEAPPRNLKINFLSLSGIGMGRVKCLKLWCETKYSRIDQVKICGRQPLKIWRDMVCFTIPYHSRLYPLLVPFLNTLSHDCAQLNVRLFVRKKIKM